MNSMIKMSVVEIISTAISLAGGLALFLYGMNMLSQGLEKLSSGRMEKILEGLTSNIFKSVLLGAGVTAAVQSSSATTVIVVGLVNAGIMKLSSAVGVIMGANIGTTVTGQLLRLGDLENNVSVNSLLSFLKPSTLAPLIAIIGILVFMCCKKDTHKNIGVILLGFGILFQGMFSIEAAARPLSELEAFQEAFKTLTNPVLGILVGVGVTALIQSSSASVGILQAVASTGAVSCAAAFPIIMGQNIGTCITALLSSIGANKNARRTAMVHLYFNIIGTVIFVILVYSLQAILKFPFWEDAIDRGGIANFHTLFNVTCTLLLLPFAKGLEKLAVMTIKDSGEKSPIDNDDGNILDERFLKSPTLAIQQSNNAVVKMGQLALLNFRETKKMFSEYSPKTADHIEEYEDAIDLLEDKLNEYLIKLTDCELTEPESRSVTALLHLLSEFERVGDYTMNLLESAQEMYEKEITFSEDAMKEFDVITQACEEIIQLALEAVETSNVDVARKIEPLEEVIDYMNETLKSRHIERFKTGHCVIESGVIFLNSLVSLERISDHCSNVGVYVLSAKNQRSVMNRHEYIQNLHKGESEEYVEASERYLAKYKL